MQANTLWSDLFTISDRNVFVRNDISLRNSGEVWFFFSFFEIKARAEHLINWTNLPICLYDSGVFVPFWGTQNNHAMWYLFTSRLK